MIIEVDKTWVREYGRLNYKIEQVISAAIQNLNKVISLNRYRVRHKEDREEIMEVEVSAFFLNIDRYFSEDLDEVDIINSALELYLPICRRERIKELISEKLNLLSAQKLIVKMGFTVQGLKADEVKGRYYFYTDCPVCGTRNFYFSLDEGLKGHKRNIYVGCYSESCKYHGRKGVDIIGFIQNQFRKSYPQAIEFLADHFLLNGWNDHSSHANLMPFEDNATKEMRKKDSDYMLRLEEYNQACAMWLNDDYLVYDPKFVDLVSKLSNPE